MPVVKAKLDCIAVPKQLAEEVFPKTNAVFIKIYIHILMLLANRESIDFGKIADELQLLESDVMQAVRYWENIGAIEVLDGAAEEKAEPEYQGNSEADEPKEYELSEITRSAENNKKLSEMLQLAEEVLGRTLSTAEMKSLYWFYDSLGFSPEVILMLLEYCVSIGKKSMSYIERVASGWHKRGINSIEAVEKFLREDEMKKNYMNNLKNLFGIRDRNLTGIEEDYLSKWHDKLDMSEEMIALAYEYCVLRINKISFPYMDKIIQEWDKKNIRTIDAAEKSNVEFQKNKELLHSENTNFDLLSDDSGSDELERLTWDKTENR